MNEIESYQAQLPDTLEDLTQFVLIGRSKLNAYKLKLQKVDKLSDAQNIREQTLQDMQDVSIAIVAAEQRIGEILLSIQKNSGGDRRSDDFKNHDSLNFEKTKDEVTSEMGYSRNQVSEYQRLAQNPEIVQKVIDDALEKGEIVTRTQVMKEIRSAKEELKRQLAEKDKKISELENREPIVEKIEVEPEDYKQLKRDLKKETKMVGALRQDLNIEKQRYDRQAKEKRKLEEKIEELQQKTVREEDKKDVNASALMFAAKCRNFLSSVGGYAFIAEYLSEMDKRERDGYIHAAKSVRDWVTILLETIERNENELFGSYK